MSLAGRTVRGILWNVGTGVSARVLSLVATVVLTRFLAPEEYGSVLAASIWVLTASQLTTVRFGHYLIAVKAGPEAAFQAFVYHTGLGLVALVLVTLFAEPLGNAVGAPGMEEYVPGLAVAVLLERLAYIPSATLQRELRYGALALARTASEIAFVVIALALVRGQGPMAVVWAHIGRWGTYSLLIVGSARRRDWFVPSTLDRGTARELFGFGLPIAVGSAADFGASKWDNLLVSRMFDAGVMGTYNLAYQLADTPSSYIAEQIGDVLFPSLASLEPSRRGAALVRAAAVMGLVVFPLAVGLAAISQTLVYVFFDERWYSMAPMLAVLSTLSISRPISWVAVSFLHTARVPRTVMWLGLLKVAMISGSILAVGWLGPLWTCAAVSVGFGSFSVATLLVIQKGHGIPMGRFALGTGLPLICCGLMALAVLGVRYLMYSSGMSPSVRMLAIEIATGAVVYVIAGLTIARPIALDFLRLARSGLRGGEPT